MQNNDTPAGIAHIHLENVSNLTGFATGNAVKGESVDVQIKGSFTSLTPEFFGYIRHLENTFLTPGQVPPDQVHQFLVVMRQDGTADVYVNDFPVSIEMRAKRDVAKGQVITQREIADVSRVRFPDANIRETDKVAYVFKAGWRFGLYFDFIAAGLQNEKPPELASPLDIDQTELSIGNLYRYLSFYRVYELIESDTERFHEMQSEGWFPFIELVPGDFDRLIDVYKNPFDFENRLDAVVDGFGEERVREISNRWWKKDVFANKQRLIEAGINAYLQNTPDGYINCVKTLFSEVEGLLRVMYRDDIGSGRMTQKEFLAHLAEKARASTGSDYSLLLAKPFLEYLEQQAFGNFDVDTGGVSLSRHTSSHGVASSELYTKARALQTILIMDQIYFFS